MPVTLGIYGAGGLGREVLDLAQVIHQATNRWEEIVFIVDNSAQSEIDGVPVYSFAQFTSAYKGAEVALGVGEPAARKLLFEKVEAAGFTLATLIHPSAYVGHQSQVGRGSILQYNAFVSCHVKIGEGALIQQLTYIGHDSEVGRFSVISSHASIAGHCVIGSETFIGLNVPVKEHVKIGSRTIVGMGACVVSHLEDGIIAIGTPAHELRKNEDYQVFK
ncbi:MAG: acetyltransferase [Eubacteriales bacterium]|nr:acetyltransferase [Eubacteriales bacterium]